MQRSLLSQSGRFDKHRGGLTIPNSALHGNFFSNTLDDPLCVVAEDPARAVITRMSQARAVPTHRVGLVALYFAGAAGLTTGTGSWRHSGSGRDGARIDPCASTETCRRGLVILRSDAQYVAVSPRGSSFHVLIQHNKRASSNAYEGRTITESSETRRKIR